MAPGQYLRNSPKYPVLTESIYLYLTHDSSLWRLLQSLSENKMSTVSKLRVNLLFFALNHPLPPSRGFLSFRCFELRNDVMTSDVSAGVLRHGMFTHPTVKRSGDQYIMFTYIYTHYVLFIISTSIVTTTTYYCSFI